MIDRLPVTVSARSAKDLPVAANAESDAQGIQSSTQIVPLS
jgi:hypothetical protein